MTRKMLSTIGSSLLLLGLSACQRELSGPTEPTPAPTTATAINSFSLTHTSGSVAASELGWTLDLGLGRDYPGLFVRVELRFGPSSQTNACYASELTQTGALSAQPHLLVRSTGFTKSVRTWPGLACDWHAFQPTSANVRIFGAADSYAQTPILAGEIPVSLVVTE